MRGVRRPERLRRRVFSMRNLNDQQVNEHSLKWPKIDSFGERRERPEVVRSRSHLKPTPDPGEDSRGGNHRVNVYNRARKGQRARRMGTSPNEWCLMGAEA